MKKIVYLFAAATMLFASCSNDDNIANDETPVSVQKVNKKNLKLNVNISNPNTDATTRAFVKTAWNSGDKLNVWFDTNTNSDNALPDLVIKYNGKAWEVDDQAKMSENIPEFSEGTMKVVYDGDVKVCAISDYKYDATSQSLNASISGWTYLTEIQVVVTGIDANAAADYTLSCDQLKAFGSYTVSADGVTASVEAADSPVQGIRNSDGIAFVFAQSIMFGSAANYRFTLTNTNNKSVKYFIGTNKNITRNNTQIIGLKLNSATFHDLANMTSADYVTIGNLQWAKMNLGATTEAGSYATCMGDYYAWGEITPRYAGITRPENATSIQFLGWKNENVGYINTTQSYTGTALDINHDAAAAALGNGWHTPSVKEFEALIKACSDDYTAGKFLSISDVPSTITSGGIYYDTNYANGISGLLFVDKSDTNKRLFFPAAFYLSGTSIQNSKNQICYYWTSDRDETRSTSARYFNFTYASSESKPVNQTKRVTLGNSYNWYNGLTIRPVKGSLPSSAQ